MIDSSKEEEEFGLLVEAHAYAVEDRGEVLAEVGVVGAVTVEADFFRGGEEACISIRHDGHDFIGKLALEQFEQASDLAGAAFFEGGPFGGGQFVDVDLDFIEFGAADEGFDASGFDFEVANGAVAHVGAAAWEAAFIVAVGFEVAAPGVAPEGFGDFVAAERFNGLDFVALLAELGHLFDGFGSAFGDGYVAGIFVVVVVAGHFLRVNGDPSSLRYAETRG